MYYLKKALIGLALVGMFFMLPKEIAHASSINWTTPQVSLTASDFSIVTNGMTFTGSGASIHSDPGTPTYTTLESTWNEQGVEMRLYMYFGVDNGQWKVTEVRTYNGEVNGDWIFYPGFSGGSLGGAYNGNLDLTSTSGGTGTVHFSNLHLQPSFVTQDYAIRVSSPNGGEQFTSGQNMHISWTFLNPGRTDTQTFGTSIYLQKDGTTVATLVNNQSITKFNDNAFDVTVPNVPTSNYKLLVYMNTAFSTANGIQNLSDTSDNTFTITNNSSTPTATSVPAPTTTPKPSPTPVVYKKVYSTPTPTPNPKTSFGDFLAKRSTLTTTASPTPSEQGKKHEITPQNIFVKFFSWFNSLFHFSHN